MKSHVPACYEDPKRPFEPSWHQVQSDLLQSRICYWISYVVDTLSTIAITGCTIFCCYLALTML